MFIWATMRAPHMPKCIGEDEQRIKQKKKPDNTTTTQHYTYDVYGIRVLRTEYINKQAANDAMNFI